jgi:DDE superfamily endonuclease
VIAYCEKKKEQLRLKKSQKVLAIFDVFVPHIVGEFLDKLKDKHILVIFIPAGCTGDQQPQDAAVNDDFKQDLKGQFIYWYLHEVEKH